MNGRSTPLLFASLACSSSADDPPTSPTATTDGGSNPTEDAIAKAEAATVDRPAPVIGKCDALPAAGTWENVTPKGQNSFGAVALDPFDVGTVWGIGDANQTAPGGIWKSTDCGATWTHVNTGMNGADIDTSRAWSIAVDYIDKGTLYLPIYYGAAGLWKSTNGGQDWTQMINADSPIAKAASLRSTAAIGSVIMDPTDHLHLLVGTHTGCASPYNPLCAGESRDGGKTWNVINVTIPGVTDWQEQAGPYIVDGKTTVYATLFAGLWYSDDSGATWHNATPQEVGGATDGEWAHHPFFKSSSTGTYYLAGYGNQNGVIQSTDGKAWTHIENSPRYSYAPGFTFAGGKLFLCDSYATTCSTATEAAPTTWTDLPANKGVAALEYDETHHVLYSANFEGGLWRTVLN